MSADTTLSIRPLTPTLGAEVLGVDLTRPLSDATFAGIQRALWDHQVIFFRDQALTHDMHLAFGRRFGSLHVHPLKQGAHPVHEELLRIHGDENSKRVPGEDWHSDVSCEPEPPMGSILHLHEVPPCGGDTLFSSMYAAYDALSPSMQRFLEGMTAVHDGGKPWMTYGYAPPAVPYPRAEHPIIAVHPETGRRCLFVNRGFTTHIPSLSRLESDALLTMLYRHVENPRFMCRFRWQANSVAFWDNRCVQHQAIWDYFPARRSGWRVTVNGTRPAPAEPRAATREAVAA